MNKITKTLLIASSLFLIGCKFDGTGLGTNGSTETGDVYNTDTNASTTIATVGISSSFEENSTFSTGVESTSDSTGTNTSITSDSSTTAPQICGNGMVDPGEDCDEGVQTAYCDEDCTFPKCGDGILNILAGEECDDGNDDDFDKCSNECQISREVFITSNVFFGEDLKGIDGADSKCQKAAENVGLQGTFKAWLSEGLNKKSQVINRFDTNFKGWYVLVNGELLAKGWADLVEKGPLVKIVITELNNKLDFTQSIDVWTNTTNKGTYLPGEPDCNGWGTKMNGEFHGRVGDANSIEFWSENIPKKYEECVRGARLYCFKDAKPGA